MSTQFIVIARDDREPGSEEPGSYSLCTRTVFDSKEAAEGYAKTMPAARECIVVPGDFSGLRFNEPRGRGLAPTA